MSCKSSATSPTSCTPDGSSATCERACIATPASASSAAAASAAPVGAKAPAPRTLGGAARSRGLDLGTESSSSARAIGAEPVDSPPERASCADMVASASRTAASSAPGTGVRSSQSGGGRELKAGSLGAAAVGSTRLGAREEAGARTDLPKGESAIAGLAL